WSTWESTDSRRKRTEKSAKRAFAPPGWVPPTLWPSVAISTPLVGSLLLQIGLHDVPQHFIPRQSRQIPLGQLAPAARHNQRLDSLALAQLELHFRADVVGVVVLDPLIAHQAKLKVFMTDDE